MKFEWNEMYSVGVKEIDGQHQRYFEIVNQINEELDKEVVDNRIIYSLVAELNDYALFHLATEEKYLTDYKYELLEEHLIEHNLFRKKMAELKNDLEKNNNEWQTIAVRLKEYAEEWLKDHILNIDKKYTLLFESHGLK